MLSYFQYLLPSLRLIPAIRTIAVSCFVCLASSGNLVAQTLAAPTVYTTAERDASLRDDQAHVLTKLGDLHTLRGPSDLARLAVLGYGPYAHGFVSYRGIGTTFVQPVSGASVLVAPIGFVVPGCPFGLLYRANSTGHDITDPDEPAFPYELVGWFYSATYIPSIVPFSGTLKLDLTDWFIHERGVHAFPNYDMVMQPPQESWRGEKPASVLLPIDPPGIAHPRVWDVHIWVNYETGIPAVSILDPLEDLPGKEGEAQMSFFYPAYPPTQ